MDISADELKELKDEILDVMTVLHVLKTRAEEILDVFMSELFLFLMKTRCVNCVKRCPTDIKYANEKIESLSVPRCGESCDITLFSGLPKNPSLCCISKKKREIFESFKNFNDADKIKYKKLLNHATILERRAQKFGETAKNHIFETNEIFRTVDPVISIITCNFDIVKTRTNIQRCLDIDAYLDKYLECVGEIENIYRELHKLARDIKIASTYDEDDEQDECEEDKETQ
jgi:hypothetical protein